MTAVEWLIDELEKWGEGRIKWPTYLWEEAEEMEKEQLKHAFNQDVNLYEFYGNDFDYYYNKTYNNSKTPPGAHCEEA